MSNFKWKIFSYFVAFSEFPNFKGLDLRTSVPARTALPNLDQSIQFDTLSAPEVPEPFTTIAPPRQNKQRIPKQRRKKIPKQRIPKQRIPKQRIPKQRNDLANDANPGKEFCTSFWIPKQKIPLKRKIPEQK